MHYALMLAMKAVVGYNFPMPKLCALLKIYFFSLILMFHPRNEGQNPSKQMIQFETESYALVVTDSTRLYSLF